MAEAAIGGEDGSERIEQPDVKPKMPAFRQPNRKKHEEELEALNNAIRAKEASIKSLNLKGDDAIQGELRALRSEKEATIGRRKKIDTELRNLNHAITKQMAELTKVQSNLQYKNEDKINSAIGNLEYQLKMQNFRLSEEKKIVAEIDSLKRSKKALGKYIELKREIDGMRDRQYRMRQERDQLYKVVTGMKMKEDEIRKTSQKGRAKADEVKREVDDLYSRRKALIMEHKIQEKGFQNFQKELRQKQREEFLRRKEEEAIARQEQYIKDMEEYEASREPYEDEKQLCNTLISYLHRYISNINGLIEPDLSQLSLEPPMCPLEAAKHLELEGLYVLRKKSVEDEVYCAKPKTKKKTSRERKKSANKPLAHTPKTLDQFAQLSLAAPLVVTDVAESIVQLEEKKKYYESLPPPNQPLVHIDIVSTACSAIDQGGVSDQDGAPSFTESAISESIPSTPEVSLDNQPPRFPRDDSSPLGEHRQRKLSRDSGACELEGQASCDEQAQLEEPQNAPKVTVPATAVSADLGDGYGEHNVEFSADGPITKSGEQTNCDDDAENDCDTICNSTDNSNETDLDNVEDVECPHDELSFPKTQVVSQALGSDGLLPNINLNQESLLPEAAAVDQAEESS